MKNTIKYFQLENFKEGAVILISSIFSGIVTAVFLFLIGLFFSFLKNFNAYSIVILALAFIFYTQTLGWIIRKVFGRTSK